MDWKFLAGILIPAMGAGFVWLLGIARKDPTLFTVLDAAISAALARVAGAFIGAGAIALWLAPPGEDRAAAMVLVGIALAGVIQTALLLPLFRRIAALPPVREQDQARQSPGQ